MSHIPKHKSKVLTFQLSFQTGQRIMHLIKRSKFHEAEKLQCLVDGFWKIIIATDQVNARKTAGSWKIRC